MNAYRNFSTDMSVRSVAPYAVPSSAKQRRALAYVMLIFLGLFLGVLPFVRHPLHPLHAFVPACLSAVAVASLVIAGMLYGQFSMTRKLSLVWFGSAYLFSSLSWISYVLTFPGALYDPAPPWVQPSTAAWVWAGIRTGFPVLILLAVAGDRNEARRWVSRTRVRGVITRHLFFGSVCTVLFVLFLVRVTTVFPQLVLSGQDQPLLTRFVDPLLLALNGAALFVCLSRLRTSTATEAWVSVAILGSLADVVLAISAGGRYSVGWYVGRSENLLAAAIVVSGLIREVVRVCTRLVRQQEHLQVLVYQDPLTGVGNRRLFLDRLAEVLASRNREGFSLLLFDLNGFKSVNDSYGHEVGDHLLCAVADRATRFLSSDQDVLARLGGDEFVLLTRAATTVDEAHRFRDQLHDALSIPFVVDGIPVTVSGSVGTAVYPFDGTDRLALLKTADQAMYDAKRVRMPVAAK